MEALVTTAPCGCERHVVAEGAWVAHNEECQARQDRENAAAKEADAAAHAAKQALQAKLAALTPGDIDRLLALDARMAALEAAAKPKPKEGK